MLSRRSFVLGAVGCASVALFGLPGCSGGGAPFEIQEVKTWLPDNVAGNVQGKWLYAKITWKNTSGAPSRASSLMTVDLFKNGESVQKDTLTGQLSEGDNNYSEKSIAADATGTFTILFRDGSKFDFGKDEFKLTIVDSANKKAVYDKPVPLS